MSESISGSEKDAEKDIFSDQNEHKRRKQLYEFLLSLTDLGMDKNSTTRKSTKKDKDGTEQPRPNETLIASQWGLNTYRIYVRRVLTPLYREIYGETKEGFPGIDLQRLVTILVSLDKYKRGEQGKRKTKSSDRVRSVLTHADQVKALRLFSELSIQEREALRWKTSIKDKLLAQLTEKLSDPSFSISEPLLREIYTLTLREDPLDNSDPRSPNPQESRKEKIDRGVRKALGEHFSTDDSALFDDLVQKCAKKVEQEVERILVQSGEQFGGIGDFKLQSKIFKPREEQLYSESFINTVIYTVIKDHILTDEFPIFIRYIDVKRIRPLPLRTFSKGQPDGLLDERLIISSDRDIVDAETREMEGLSGQTAYKVKIFFGMTEFSKDADGSFAAKEGNGMKLFYDEAMGIGSPISLATAIINRLILSDLDCLKDRGVFPIAKQILLNDKILGDKHSSPIWSHSIVQLCNEGIIEKSIAEFNKIKDQEDRKEIDEGEASPATITDYYNSIDSFGEAASGDACGFDLLEVVIKSGLSARLNAVKKLGIESKEYMYQMTQKIDEIDADRIATDYFRKYPLSFWAMEMSLEKKLLGKYRKRLLTDTSPAVISESAEVSEPKEGIDKSTEVDKSEESVDEPIEVDKCEDVRDKWSYLAYNSHLKVVEYCLVEGKTSRARKYLDVIDKDQHRVNMPPLLKAKLSYLKAYYFYLYNLKAVSSDIKERYRAIRYAEYALKEAKQFLQQIVEECYAINETSFYNPHAFFTILGRINHLEASFRLFFRAEAYDREEKGNNLELVLSSLQKARIYAAKAGNYNDYMCFSTIQSWVFLMTDYLPEDKYRFRKISNRIPPNEGEIIWSEQLIKHAMICYSEIGKESYIDIKENTGVKCFFDKKGDMYKVVSEEENKANDSIRIEEVSFVEERSEDPAIDENQKRPVQLNIPLLRREVKMSESSEREVVSLFGPFSSILLFGLGANQIMDENFPLTLERAGRLADKIAKFDESIKLFIMSLSIAQDGGRIERKGNAYEIDRRFERAIFDAFGVSNIRGFYPCRISQIVPLSAIGMISATLLKLVYIKSFYSEQEWESLSELYLQDQLATTKDRQLKNFAQCLRDRAGEFLPLPKRTEGEQEQELRPEDLICTSIINSITTIKRMFDKYREILEGKPGRNFDGQEKEIRKDKEPGKIIAELKNEDFNSHLSEHMKKAMEYLHKFYEEEVRSEHGCYGDNSDKVLLNEEQLSRIEEEFTRNKKKLFSELFPIILGDFE